MNDGKKWLWSLLMGMMISTLINVGQQMQKSIRAYTDFIEVLSEFAKAIEKVEARKRVNRWEGIWIWD